MNYPKLVRKDMCKTDITVTLYDEDYTEDGSPSIALSDDFTCNYQDSSKRIYTDEKTYVEISGIALFSEDIAPDLPVISSGQVEIFGETRTIYKGTKARNPDGTVNYVKLELI